MGNLLIVIVLTFVFSFFLIYLIQKTSKRAETAEEKSHWTPVCSTLTWINSLRFVASYWKKWV